MNSTIKKRNQGFTLIELLVVVSIIAILSAVGLAAFTGSQKRARDARRQADVQGISDAAESYYITSTTAVPPGGDGAYPTDDTTLQTFMSGLVPVDPQDASGYVWVARTATTFQVCADLESDGRGAADAGGGVNDYCRYNRQ